MYCKPPFKVADNSALQQNFQSPRFWRVRHTTWVNLKEEHCCCHTVFELHLGSKSRPPRSGSVNNKKEDTDPPSPHYCSRRRPEPRKVRNTPRTRWWSVPPLNKATHSHTSKDPNKKKKNKRFTLERHLMKAHTEVKPGTRGQGSAAPQLFNRAKNGKRKQELNTRTNPDALNGTLPVHCTTKTACDTTAATIQAPHTR